MIIDIHTHHYLGKETAKTEQPVEPFIALAAEAGISHINMLGNLCRNGSIFRAPKNIIREINSLSMKQVAEHPNELSAFCFLNPALDRKFLVSEIDRCVKHGNLSGLKFEIDLNCRDKRMDPLLKRAAQLDIPVLHHSWYFKGREMTQPEASEPHDVADLARRHPNVQIIMAHLAGCGVRGVLDILPYDNVLIDTSGGQPTTGFVEYAVDKLGPKRVIYGSDVVVRDFASQVARVTGAKISDKDKETVLWKNAAKLLKLEKRGII